MGEDKVHDHADFVGKAKVKVELGHNSCLYLRDDYELEDEGSDNASNMATPFQDMIGKRSSARFHHKIEFVTRPPSRPT